MSGFGDTGGNHGRRGSEIGKQRRAVIAEGAVTFVALAILALSNGHAGLDGAVTEKSLARSQTLKARVCASLRTRWIAEPWPAYPY